VALTIEGEKKRSRKEEDRVNRKGEGEGMVEE
jgi:hypothetical protein